MSITDQVVSVPLLRVRNVPLAGAGKSVRILPRALFGIIFCDPETVLIPPTTTRIAGRFDRTVANVAVVIS